MCVCVFVCVCHTHTTHASASAVKAEPLLEPPGDRFVTICLEATKGGMHFSQPSAWLAPPRSVRPQAQHGAWMSVAGPPAAAGRQTGVRALGASAAAGRRRARANGLKMSKTWP